MKVSSSQNKFYNSVQKDKRESLGYYQDKIDFIIKASGENKVILDVGCNDGYIGGLLKKNKNIIYGIDIVGKNLILARKKGIIAKKIDVEQSSLPFKNNYFDTLILGDIIEHIFDTDNLLQKCYKVLKPGGKLIVTTPNVASFGRRIMLLFGKNPFLEFSAYLPVNGLPSVGHIRYYTVSNLSEQLMKNKFKIQTIEGNCLNLYLFSTKILNRIKPSLCMMLFCIATK